MKFYEIDAQIEAALEQLVDEDGVINEEAEAALDALEAANEQKTESILLAIKGPWPTAGTSWRRRPTV